MNKAKAIAKGVLLFCTYLSLPQWGNKNGTPSIDEVPFQGPE